MNKKIIYLFLLLACSTCLAATIDMGKGIPLNPDFDNGTGAPSLASFTLDATDEKWAGVFPIPSTVTFRKFGFFTGGVTTGDTIDVRLESVSEVAPGAIPSGNLFCASSSASYVIGNADDNKYKETNNLVSDCTVTNSTIAIVVVRRGSFNGAFTAFAAGRMDNTVLLSSTSTSGWTNSTSMGNLVAYDDSGSIIYIPGTVAISSLTSTNVNSASSPNTYGNKITLPFAHRVTGAYYNTSNTATPIQVKIWGSGGATLLETVVVSTAMARGNVKAFAKFSQSYSFAANESYRLSITPKLAVNVVLIRYVYETSDIKNAFVQFGQYMDFSTGTNPAVEGDWTQNTLGIQRIFPVIDQFETGSGGGTAIGVIGN